MRCLSANPHTASKHYWKTKTQLQAARKAIHPICSLCAGHLSMSKPELGTEHRYSSPHSGCLPNISLQFPQPEGQRFPYKQGFGSIYPQSTSWSFALSHPSLEAGRRNWSKGSFSCLSPRLYNLIPELDSLWNIQSVQNNNLPESRSQ